MKQISDLYTGILLTIVGLVIMILPLFDLTNFKLIFQVVLIIYAILNLARYVFLNDKKDKEGVITFLAMVVLFLLTFINLEKNNLITALILFSFAIVISFIKLKKADFYHDHKNKMWIFEITSLVVFVLLAFIDACYVLLEINPISLFGNLLLFNGFLELEDPIINYIKKK